MYLSQLTLENFRIFGADEKSGRIQFNEGVTAIVGGNDHGKTAVIDAIRLALGTNDSDYTRITPSDFHSGSSRDEPAATEFAIRCKFEDLNQNERGAFAEFLTYKKVEDESENLVPVLYLNVTAKHHEKTRKGRPYITTEIKSGPKADGLSLDQNARSLLSTTYLKPLRDAEREMSAGRGSRLSQILLNSNGINNSGKGGFSSETPPKNTEEIKELSVLGLGDYTNQLISQHQDISKARENLDERYLSPLAFSNENKPTEISIGSRGDDKARLRQLLEKLELQFKDSANSGIQHGLGSNNLMYMACELLLLGDETESTPLLLIEEPEAHLHPQRQLLLTQFLQKRSSDIQVILTTHSPNISSALPIDSLVLMQNGKAFSLAKGKTELHENDYRFLQRFLDVTKANLFFARGVAIVEGDAENILLPTLAKLLGRDFAKNGVSIVNVGNTALARYAKVLMRRDPSDGEIEIPVACITDLDVMPDWAPDILGLKDKKGRKWKKVSDFDDEDNSLEKHKRKLSSKASGQNAKTFVSDKWTLEYDLADTEIAEDIYVATQLAKQDANICDGKKTVEEVMQEAQKSFKSLAADKTRAAHIYSKLANKGISKAITAQYLADLLEKEREKKPDSNYWGRIIPPYLVAAIKHVTKNTSAEVSK